MRTQKKQKLSLKQIAYRAGATVLCMAVAFMVGIQTSSDVHPIGTTKAGGTDIAGDFDGNGKLDMNDVKLALEIAKGYRKAERAQLLADPDGDAKITVEDALTVLSLIQHP